MEIPRLSSLIALATLENDGNEPNNCTKLDSHANMVVIGQQSVIFDVTGLTCTVNAFTESAGKLDKVPIVDAAVAYNCPYLAKTFVLLFRNVLRIPKIRHNLLPPFIVREAGHFLDECPKFQSSSPTVANNLLYCPEVDLRIHFGLINTFSFFITRKPTKSELESCDKIFLTPDSTSWNPHSNHFSHNEESMLNVDGEITQSESRNPELVERDEVMYEVLPSVETVDGMIDDIIEQNELYHQEMAEIERTNPPAVYDISIFLFKHIK